LLEEQVSECADTAATFQATADPVRYRSDYDDEAGNVAPGEVAVRRYLPSASTRPSSRVEGAPAPGAAADDGFLIREWSPWIVAAALALMTIEWWIGHQRPGIRRREVTT